MRKILIFIILTIILANQAYSLVINEIMYNPPDELGGKYNEWIELYNPSDEIVNLTGWKIADPSDHILDASLGDYIEPNGYFILAKTPDDFLQYYDIECNVVKTAFYLSNSGEEILLKDPDDNIVDSLTYDDSLADGDGNTLQSINDSWCAGLPTPCRENYCPPEPSFTLSYPPFVLSDGTYFLVGTEISGFPDGAYDIKIDIKDEDGQRIARLYNPNEEKWQSTTYYIKGISMVEEGYGNFVAYTKIDPDKDYTGTATIQAKLRLSGSSSSTGTSLQAFNVVENMLYEEVQETTETAQESTQQQNSSIEILGSESSAEFGDIIKVKLKVFRGSILKYAVYAYVVNDKNRKVSEKTTMHFKSKNTDYTLTVPVQLNFNCNERYDEGDYTIIVEGLDEEDTEEITLSGKSSECGKAVSSSTSNTPTLASPASLPKFTYEISSKPDEIEAEKSFTTKVDLTNNDDELHDFEIWSYVFRGPKSYSGDRESNKKIVSLKPGVTKVIELENKVDDAKPGDYSIKIKLKRDDQKTVKELTEPITVKASPKDKEQQEEFLQLIGREGPVRVLKTPVGIYESKKIQTKELTLYLIIVLAILIDIALIMKK